MWLEGTLRIRDNRLLERGAEIGRGGDDDGALRHPGPLRPDRMTLVPREGVVRAIGCRQSGWACAR